MIRMFLVFLLTTLIFGGIWAFIEQSKLSDKIFVLKIIGKAMLLASLAVAALALIVEIF